ncbi:MAG: chemotaxis protein CheW [Rhizomicrobium sp.]|jgi:purine-binding chemotaxis protein CheW
MRSAADKQPDSVQGMSGEVLVFRVRTQEFCVDVSRVKEIRGWTAATLLPHSPPYLLGVINLRGTVLPIVDVAARLNFPVGAPSHHPVIVVVWIETKQIGLLVDAVCDILEINENALQPTPQLSSATVQDLVTALVSADDRMIGLLALDRILPRLEDGIV